MFFKGGSGVLKANRWWCFAFGPGAGGVTEGLDVKWCNSTPGLIKLATSSLILLALRL